MAGKTGWFNKIVDNFFSFLSKTEVLGNHPFKTWRVILAILFLAFLLRIPFVLFPEVIHNDSTEYIRHAKEVAAGNWTGGKSGPLYPVLIAFSHLFTKNYELAGIWVSVILGSLLVLPVFYLGKAVFNEKVGMLSALLVTVQPSLYVYSGSVLTESTYYFIVTVSVFYGWKAFEEGRPWSIVLLGLFSTLTYLTKPEAFIFIVPFCFWALLINPPRTQRPIFKRTGVFLMVLACFLAFSLPYLIQLRKESGKWKISKKASVILDVSSDKRGDGPVKLGKGEIKINLRSFVENPLPFFQTVVFGLFRSLYRFMEAYAHALFFLAILGWIGIFRNRSSSNLKGNFYILSYHILFFGFVFPFFWVQKRYVSQMVAISLPWAAFGYLNMIDWAHQWPARQRLSKKIFVIVFLILLGGFLIKGVFKHFEDHRLIQKEAGLWMKDHLPKGMKVMSRLPQEAFYAELPWIILPKKSYEEVLKAARFNGVQYLIVSEDIEEDSPGFLGKMEEKDLILLKDLKRKNQRVAIFKVIYSE